MQTPKLVGEVKITAKNRVILPDSAMRLLDWKQGDQLLVEVMGENGVLLIRRPEQWVEAFAGQLTDVFGTHEETVCWLEAERQSWEGE